MSAIATLTTLKVASAWGYEPLAAEIVAWAASGSSAPKARSRATLTGARRSPFTKSRRRRGHDRTAGAATPDRRSAFTITLHRFEPHGSTDGRYVSFCDWGCRVAAPLHENFRGFRRRERDKLRAPARPQSRHARYAAQYVDGYGEMKNLSK